MFLLVDFLLLPLTSGIKTSCLKNKLAKHCRACIAPNQFTSRRTGSNRLNTALGRALRLRLELKHLPFAEFAPKNLPTFQADQTLQNTAHGHVTTNHYMEGGALFTTASTAKKVFVHQNLEPESFVLLSAGLRLNLTLGRHRLLRREKQC